MIAFEFLNDGHRLPGDNTTWVARGWIGPKDGFTGDMGAYNDWLIKEVPLPGAVWLFGSGVASLVAIRRRKQRQAA